MQLPAHSEGRHCLRGHWHLLAGPGIAPGPRLPLLDGESTEAAQFDPLAACQRGGDLTEHRLNNQLGMCLA
jgi:hypothetical protein